MFHCHVGLPEDNEIFSWMGMGIVAIRRVRSKFVLFFWFQKDKRIISPWVSRLILGLQSVIDTKKLLLGLEGEAL